MSITLWWLFKVAKSMKHRDTYIPALPMALVTIAKLCPGHSLGVHQQMDGQRRCDIMHTVESYLAKMRNKIYAVFGGKANVIGDHPC